MDCASELEMLLSARLTRVSLLRDFRKDIEFDNKSTTILQLFIIDAHLYDRIGQAIVSKPHTTQTSDYRQCRTLYPPTILSKLLLID